MVGDLKEPQPLILTDTAEPTFVLPNARKLLVIPSNASILIACPGKNNNLQNFGSKQSVQATCLAGKQFLVGSEVHEFSTFRCKTLPKETVKKIGFVCLKRHLRYDIGFALDDKTFLPILEICQDNSTYRTYYSKVQIAKEILGFQSRYPRPHWKYGSFYPGYNMNEVYKAASQLRSMAILLGSEDLASEYVRPTAGQYFNRGHLSAKADFIYGAQQTATFWHLNTAPQWGTFNSGNWMILESNIRDLAVRRRMDLTVYTGVHGVAALTDVNGDEQPLYLHANETDRAFPVPRFFWKVAHDPIGNRATAFVGLNEPRATSITSDMYLCPDISGDGRFKWLTWRPNNTKKGVSYVCSVEELRKAVPTIPSLGEIGVLM